MRIVRTELRVYLRDALLSTNCFVFTLRRCPCTFSPSNLHSTTLKEAQPQAELEALDAAFSLRLNERDAHIRLDPDERVAVHEADAAGEGRRGVEEGRVRLGCCDEASHSQSRRQ